MDTNSDKWPRALSSFTLLRARQRTRQGRRKETSEHDKKENRGGGKEMRRPIKTGDANRQHRQTEEGGPGDTKGCTAYAGDVVHGERAGFNEHVSRFLLRGIEVLPCLGSENKRGAGDTQEYGSMLACVQVPRSVLCVYRRVRKARQSIERACCREPPTRGSLQASTCR